MSVLEALLCLAIVFGPILGYIPQYQQILLAGNPQGFSTLVCFILIAANVLRVFFWMLKGFELSLLFQSVVMIVAQLVLLELIVRINLRRRPTKSEGPNYDVTRGFDMGRFWKWDYFGEYVAFLATFIATVGALTAVNLWIFKSSLITETLGFLALMIESTLAMPQFYQNFNSKMELVLTWFAGDAFKTIFFIARKAPTQFLLCGLIQLAVDVGIAYQMLTYPRDADPSSHLHEFGSKRSHRPPDSHL